MAFAVDTWLGRRSATLPGVPCGTCCPHQLHGTSVRHAITAQACSGVSVNGAGGAHGGRPGALHSGGSA